MLIMDKVFYNEYVKNNRESYDFRKSFISDLNGKKIKKALRNINALQDKYNIYECGFMNDVLFYLFLALNECDFTDIQKERLSMWIDGYTEQDIADRYNVSRWVVSKSINAACNKVVAFLVEEVV